MDKLYLQDPRVFQDILHDERSLRKRDRNYCVKYAFESYQARKVKMQSKEHILTSQMLKYNADQSARKQVLPISTMAKETYSLFS